MVWIILNDKRNGKEIMVESEDIKSAREIHEQYGTDYTHLKTKSDDTHEVSQKPSEIKELIRTETLKWLKELEEAAPRRVEKLKASFEKRPGL